MQVAPMFKYMDRLVARGLGLDEVTSGMAAVAVKHSLTLSKARDLWAYKADHPFVQEVMGMFGEQGMA